LSRQHWRIAMPWLALIVFWLAALWLRLGFISSTTVTQICEVGQPPAWCGVRQVLIFGFLYDVYGVAALLAAVMSLFARRVWPAWLAAALGALSLLLFCYETGALALLVGGLRLLRLQLTPGTPVEQHRQRQGQIQTQP
jgi:hypothetical protein